MGSMISLSVGSIDIDWGKNEFFENHAHLFQPGDESENDYHYVKEDGSPIVKVQQCLKRPLGRVVPRLELLGYTLPSCAAKLTAWLGDEDETGPASMTAFRHALTTFQWRECGEYVDFEEAFRAAYAAAPDSNVPPDQDSQFVAWERPIDPYLVLRVLGDMPEYVDLPVCWNFADVLEGEYVDSETFEPSPPGERWMIVTEGTSDTFVLQRSLQLTHPDISDFFDFIDMSAGNPFPGVGNVVMFCRGLSRIRYDGRMLVVLDNDTAGRSALAEIKALKMPTSFVATCLPDLPELQQIQTLGPTGMNIEDINGRASAIECFLDFKGVDSEPAVRWTSYMPKQASYQGELVSKDAYVADFKARFGKDQMYDKSKLTLLWQHLIRHVTAYNAPLERCSATIGAT
ncbi:HEPN/Toprim-associated domain-containing protein [Burkholderia seminalis]|uniref:HEPN/Toprim N-terminal domain-containing protein n=3 Tax=Burkholderia TaxID=32008 RepID=A0A8A8D2K5_9BURK|nr:HEPN/Toprim-associated domain-containing protein [Burkholderia seminalis]QTO18924.1 hypothetical protein DT99_001320 [Burkholderia seminalis]